jgi:hypothetical protein
MSRRIVNDILEGMKCLLYVGKTGLLSTNAEKEEQLEKLWALAAVWAKSETNNRGNSRSATKCDIPLFSPQIGQLT